MAKFLLLNENREVVTQLIKGVHDIPAGAVQIDDERWYAVTQDAASIWRLDESGELSKRPRPDVAGERTAQELAREWRNQMLAATEWLVTRQRDEQDLARPTTLSAAQFAELLDFRQALRDWPQSGNFPEASARPAPPSFLEQMGVEQ